MKNTFYGKSANLNLNILPFDDTIGKNGKVSLRSKEENRFYQKVLKRIRRVKSTVADEGLRIEEVLKEIPIEQQQSLSEAIVQPK